MFARERSRIAVNYFVMPVHATQSHLKMTKTKRVTAVLSKLRCSLPNKNEYPIVLPRPLVYFYMFSALRISVQSLLKFLSFTFCAFVSSLSKQLTKLTISHCKKTVTLEDLTRFLEHFNTTSITTVSTV
jgi:hypothetical protein